VEGGFIAAGVTVGGDGGGWRRVGSGGEDGREGPGRGRGDGGNIFLDVQQMDGMDVCCEKARRDCS
jgi:hypothetical protein